MKTKMTALCLLFIALLLSCKKEDLQDVTNSVKAPLPLLSKVMVENQSKYEYIYNDSNMVSQEKSTFDFKANHYNTDGLLVRTDYFGDDNIFSSDAQVSATAANSTTLVTLESGKKTGTIMYEYNNNSQLIKTAYSQPSSQNSEISEFTYNDNNRISRQTMYYDNTASGYINYTYDGKGNLTSEMLYNLLSDGNPELITTINYVYDSEQNPYKNISRLMIPGIYTNQNNIIKETYTIHLSPSEGSDNVQITENAYEYNALGYPTTKNGNVTYIYQ
jgi:hypothetical protein